MSKTIAEELEKLQKRVEELEKLNIATEQEVTTNEYRDGKQVFIKNVQGTVDSNGEVLIDIKIPLSYKISKLEGGIHTQVNGMLQYRPLRHVFRTLRNYILRGGFFR